MSRWIVLMVSMLLSAACASAPQPPGGDAQAVREAAAAFYSALNVLFTGNAGPMQEVWSHSEDVTYMGPVGGLKKGWKEVLEDWNAQAAMKLGGTVQPEDMHVTVGRDLALTQN